MHIYVLCNIISLCLLRVDRMVESAARIRCGRYDLYSMRFSKVNSRNENSDFNLHRQHYYAIYVCLFC